MRRPTPARRPLCRLAGVVLALVPLAVAGCGGSTSAGDPGGKRLKALASDPVFAAAPPGSTDVRKTETPAHNRKGGFTAGGWSGPSVVVDLESTAPAPDVYGFYAREAETAGWRPTATGSLGVADRWARTYTGGVPATLLLSTLGAGRYRLSGAVAPAVS